MKNIPLIIGVIIVLLAAAGGYFFMQSRSSANTMEPSGKKMAEGGSGMMSLTELMKLGTNQMCTFSTSNENGSMEGTTYIADGRVRTDFNGTDSENGPTSGGMILDSEYMYTWTDQQEKGIKLPVSSMEEMKDTAMEYSENEDKPKQPKALDPDEKIEYNCSNWNVDESVFTPPSDIPFTDFSEQIEMMKQMMPSGAEEQTMEKSTGTTDVKAAQCAACDQAGEGAAACRQALGC